MSYEKIKAVFMGTPEFAVDSLKALNDKENVTVEAVFTQPDRPKGRGHKLKASPVKEYAEENNLKIYQPLSLRKGEDGEMSQKILNDISPDIIIVAAYGQILPEEVLNLPRFGCVNVHASLLPKYRGASPIESSIMNGEKTTGITTMLMGKGLDTGDILMQEETEIGENETGSELRERLAKIGADLLCQTIDGIVNKTITPKKQDDSISTYAPKITKEMSELDFSLPAQKLHDIIRAISGYTFLNGKRFKVYRSEIVEGKADCPVGTVIEGKKAIIVSAGNSTALKFTEVQPEGKKRMPVEDFLRGRSIPAGTVFGK